ncbi:hypothetical protein FQN57_002293 [Myotisia sp. PD_48]|nr:hypothetical protein FQN57_002293 [Myotisia sp. PD_48]
MGSGWLCALEFALGDHTGILYCLGSEMSGRAAAECDSRTASVGNLQSKKKNKPSRRPQIKSKKRNKRKKNEEQHEIQEFVPKGASFTASTFAMDTSSSSSNQDTAAPNHNTNLVPPQNSSNSFPPTTSENLVGVNWNNVQKNSIRTSLRRKELKTDHLASSFAAVNTKYWRSRSESASSSNSKVQHGLLDTNGKVEFDLEMSGDDDSDQSDLSAGIGNRDSLVINMDGLEKANELADCTSSSDSPEPTSLSSTNTGGLAARNSAQLDGTLEISTSKEDAFCAFESKYSIYPKILADLKPEDLKTQAKYIFYNVPLESLDQSLPIRCTDCTQEGHLADTCPGKECEHCGAWGLHDSRFCPTWRRCQRCRERGHSKEACSSALQGSAEEVPCDLCGSNQHLESECDLMWKWPHHLSPSGKIFISVCCACCTSNQHLIGDCPDRHFSMSSTSWSLKSFDMAMISNLSYAYHQDGNRNEGFNLSIRGLARKREATPEHDEFHIGSYYRPPQDVPRNHIRFASGLGQGRNLGPDPGHTIEQNGDHYSPANHDRDYRDRDDFFGSRSRNRSQSPGQHPTRKVCSSKGRYRPLESAPLGREPQKSHRGAAGKGRGGRGRGRGRNLSPSRDTYRPGSGRRAK